MSQYILTIFFICIVVIVVIWFFSFKKLEVWPLCKENGGTDSAIVIIKTLTLSLSLGN